MIRTRCQGDVPFFPNMLNNGAVEVCLKEDVDKVIAEKDAEIASLKAIRKVHVEAIAELKSKLESVQASAYADSVDAGMRERRLRRALYKALANWAKSFKTTAEILGAHVNAVKWDNMEHKCLKKAEEYR